MAFLKPKLGPCAPLGDAGVDGLADDSGADAPCSFDLFAGVVERVGYGGLGAVFVGGYGRGGKSGGVVEFFVVSPIRAAVGRC